MSHENSQEQLKMTLERLEAQLERPAIAGEMVNWLQKAEQEFGQLVGDLDEHLRSQHAEQFQRIVEQDDGLIHRVEQLKQEDQEILEESRRQAKNIAALSHKGEQVEPNEVRVAGATDKIVDEGLQLVIRIRKQEAALDTWFLEAFDRDRGVVD